MPAILNPQKLLPALLFLAIAALNAGSSGGVRFGGEEDGGSGLGGTGKTPTGGSGLGGTGFRPFLGAAGEVRIRREPDAVAIAGQLAEEDIKRIPETTAILPPVAVVASPRFAAAHAAEVAIADSIQTRLQREAAIYERIRESVAGYHPPSVDRPAPRTFVPAPERRSPDRGQPEPEPEKTAAVAVAVPEEDPEPAATSGEDAVFAQAPDPTRITWAELSRYLAENSPSPASDEARPAEAAEESASIRRPDRIRRPDLPPVQRGRIIQRPALLPPRVQPMRF